MWDDGIGRREEHNAKNAGWSGIRVRHGLWIVFRITPSLQWSRIRIPEPDPSTCHRTLVNVLIIVNPSYGCYISTQDIIVQAMYVTLISNNNNNDNNQTNHYRPAPNAQANHTFAVSNAVAPAYQLLIEPKVNLVKRNCRFANFIAKSCKDTISCRTSHSTRTTIEPISSNKTRPIKNSSSSWTASWIRASWSSIS
jgi:hypothetical protein